MKNNKKLSVFVNGVERFPVDSNNVIIQRGDTISVPEQDTDKFFSPEFKATVVDYLENGDILIEDSDSDFFHTKPSIVEIVGINS